MTLAAAWEERTTAEQGLFAEGQGRGGADAEGRRECFGGFGDLFPAGQGEREGEGERRDAEEYDDGTHSRSSLIGWYYGDVRGEIGTWNWKYRIFKWDELRKQSGSFGKPWSVK